MKPGTIAMNPIKNAANQGPTIIDKSSNQYRLAHIEKIHQAAAMRNADPNFVFTFTYISFP